MARFSVSSLSLSSELVSFLTPWGREANMRALDSNFINICLYQIYNDI